MNMRYLALAVAVLTLCAPSVLAQPAPTETAAQLRARADPCLLAQCCSAPHSLLAFSH
jgi:hypothetical protein